MGSSGVKVRETEASNFAKDLKMETSQLNTKIEYLEKELGEKNDKLVTQQVQLENIMDKCDSLQKKAAPVISCDVTTQYTFVDEALEEVRAAEIRERESLAQRLETNLLKIKDLEKDREHWKLEYQLMQIKMEKLKQESGPVSDISNLELDEVMSLREEELKSVWEAKIDELIASRLLADSKAVAYYLELEALTARLHNKKKEGEKLSREASTARLEEDKVREEIALTKENYESQLSVMSDHLASMNSKLAEQEDQIIQLKFEQK